MAEAPSAADLALLDPDGTFALRLIADRAALCELADVLAATVPTGGGSDRLAALERLAHRLAGAAGTFGHAAVSAAALDLEERMTGLRNGTGNRQDAADALAALVGALDRAIETARG